MRCFLIGIAGFLCAGLIAAFALAQYADYASRASLSETTNLVAPLRDEVAAKIRKGPLNSEQLTSAAPRELVARVNYLKVMPDGTIVFRSAKHGQVIVFEPAVRGGAVDWKCIGGSPKDIPPSCR